MSSVTNFKLTSEWQSVFGTVASTGATYTASLIGNKAQVARGTASTDAPPAGTDGTPMVGGGPKLDIGLSSGEFLFARNRNPLGLAGGTLVLDEET